MKTHATFKAFEQVMEIIMNTDLLDSEEKKDYLTEWYGCYKETTYTDVIEWATFWFHDVNNNTHNFWLDKRGLMLYELKGMICVSGIFPTF